MAKLKKPILYEELLCLSCIHFVMGSGNNEEAPVCLAFPSGIPKKILDGTIQHIERLPEQKNDIVWTDDLETASKAFDKVLEIENG